MDNLANLIPMIGGRKTLIIAGGSCGLSRVHEVINDLFICQISGSVLHPYDHAEKEKIRNYIDNKGCTQILLVGSIEQVAIDRIQQSDPQPDLAAGLKYNASILLRHKANAILPLSRRDQMLTEMLVISQCKVLMDYYFIRPRFDTKQLHIRGVISETLLEPFKSVFYDGITYNDLISMN